MLSSSENSAHRAPRRALTLVALILALLTAPTQSLALRTTFLARITAPLAPLVSERHAASFDFNQGRRGGVTKGVPVSLYGSCSTQMPKAAKGASAVGVGGVGRWRAR